MQTIAQLLKMSSGLINAAIIIVCVLALPVAQAASNTQAPDAQSVHKGPKYINPILHVDYSDPDVVRVGSDYYMTASSFNASPGLPILHSTDLINWKLINYALPRLIPDEHFKTPRHGEGVWAPNIRYHNNTFWIFYPDPDFGIYVTTARHPEKEWTRPKLILPGKGLIDPTPVWDSDGRAYLIHAWAKSRSGFNNVLSLREMAPDASWVASDYEHIIDGSNFPLYRTIEGPKFYRRGAFYYIFAPAGGVDLGWQSVFRARDIRGPYEAKVVLAQGETYVNGPHQGSWISTESDEDWFIHFQSKKAYGRIVHLQPVTWADDWPVIGADPDGDGIGEPVSVFKRPKAQVYSGEISPFHQEDFNQNNLGLAWQWNGNPSEKWFSLTERPGFLRLYSQVRNTLTGNNLWMTPSILQQKLPAEQFIAETRFDLTNSSRTMDAGLILFGEDYAWIGVQPNTEGQMEVVYVPCKEVRKHCDESQGEKLTQPMNSSVIELRVTVQTGAFAVFSYRTPDMERFRPIGEHFSARKGRWVGAKVGLFTTSENASPASFVDVDYLRYK